MKKTDFVSKTGPVYPLADPNESHKETFNKACTLYDDKIKPLFFKLRQQHHNDEELASLEKTVQTLRVTYGDAYFKVTNPSLDNATRNHGESDYTSCLDYIGDFYDNFILLCNKLSADPNAIKDLKTLDSFFIQMCNTFENAYLGASASVQELSDDLIQ